MSPIPVLSLVVRAELRNRVRRQVKRLRQPKYLIATIVGLTYLWFVALRRFVFFGATPRSLAKDPGSVILPSIEAAFLLFALIQVTFIWFFPADRSQFGFNEGEVQFLFPAPVTRHWLVNYKLLKRMTGIVLGTLITMLFMSRGLSAAGGHPLVFACGAGLAFITAYLHRVAAAFTKERLRQFPTTGTFGLWFFLTAMLGLLTFAIWRSWRAAATISDMRNITQTLNVFMSVHPLDWLLFPFRLMLNVMFAKDAKQFFLSLPPALVLLALHYVWLLLVLVPFEESALQSSELRSRMSRDSRRRDVRPNKWFALRLPATGRPELAIIWKNWLAAIRKVGARTIILIFALGVAILSLTTASKSALHRAQGAGAGMAMAGILTLGLLVLLGPTLIRIDLRHDLKRLDVLKCLPLKGIQIVSAEVLASTLLLLSLEFLSGAVAFWFSDSVWKHPLIERFGVGVGIAALLPGISMLGMLVQNAATLLFPSWIGTGEARARGIEATGQRLLTVGGTMLVVTIGILPSAAIGAIVFFATWTSLGFYAIPIAGILGGGVLIGESYFGLLALGRLFDAHDVSD